MITKEKAETRARRGTARWLRVSRTLRPARYQKGAAAAYITAQVAGLRYPSGICIENLL
jgi:hypothetical protein